ncbi:MAG TPA: ankyrin repeat domain-containing protein [Woeseiaceae bacterium]|nr:ankyrin repeat domain-containing protein [Woeseiaceae bacterium]
MTIEAKNIRKGTLVSAGLLSALLLVSLAVNFGPADSPVGEAENGIGDESLITAIKNERSAEVADLLRRGIDLNVQDELGATALAWAVVRGHSDVVEQLVRSGADPNLTNVMGVGPLTLALESDSVKIVRLLLENGASANARSKGGETPLMMAVHTGSAESVQLLLSHGADPDARADQFGQTALMRATGQPEIVRMLLNHGADPGLTTKSWTITAVNYTPIIHTLGVTGIPWSHDGEYQIKAGGQNALHLAAQKNDLESVKSLLDAGMDVDTVTADGTTPLLAALYHWSAGPSGRNYQFAGDIEIANLLLDRGAKVDVSDQAGYTPLHGAALILVLKDPEGAQRLAFNPAQANRPDRPRPSPPKDAGNVVTLVQRLIDAGADPNQPTLLKTPGPVNVVRINPCPPGSTPFHVIAASRSEALAKLFSQHGADPNRVRDDGHTPFSLAVMNNDLPLVKVMVEYGADIHRRYDPIDLLPDPVESETLARSQQSILHIAAVQGSEWVISYLVAKGAPLDAINDAGETPLALADALERYRVAKETEGFLGSPLSENLERETQTTDAFRAAYLQEGLDPSSEQARLAY